jgi:hypothetical protein
MMVGCGRRAAAPPTMPASESNPDLDAPPFDQAVAYLAQSYGIRPSHARFMRSIERRLLERWCWAGLIRAVLMTPITTRH